ncbi:MAG: tRNA (adenosine(37)-N6)-threonylcarbamoyltransferase complex transferase subunit TsaD [Puniceicoccaceae bacterium]|nr:MAG: tRNA (adenosine(37)-N6)-threonylcarbamoyltransferase complex transferase subunit TsaD [Puniceicoccaceae bacterium]
MAAASAGDPLLGIETSCDESALALFDPARGLLGEWISSQVKLHAAYGGVVPDLASREHLENLPLLLREVLAAHPGLEPGGIAVTTGPGLAPCLALGLAAARALALRFQSPIHPVNHLRAHAFSVFIPAHEADPAGFASTLASHLPHLGLIVSGGNTLLIEIRPDLSLRLLGETIDDAGGEALDKAAKLLGLGYPGGPLIEQRAADGDPRAFDFPRALPGRDTFNFSFSGLKTSLRYRIQDWPPEAVRDRLADLCASYQEAVVAALARKVALALDRFPFRSLGLSGGVANNRSLRHRLAALADERGVAFLPALPRHTGDNAGMIAFTAWLDRHRPTAPLAIAPVWPPARQ